jgi:hypothetical protein
MTKLIEKNTNNTFSSEYGTKVFINISRYENENFWRTSVTKNDGVEIYTDQEKLLNAVKEISFIYPNADILVQDQHNKKMKILKESI